MAHITSIGAALYSDLSVHFGANADTNVSVPATPDVITNWATLFSVQATSAGATSFTRIINVREFPSMGTPPNIVNVPVYGQKTSQQIQGQADAPTIEITINYIPSEWAAGTLLGDSVGDSTQHAFRFTLLNAQPPGYTSIAGTTSLGGDTSDGTTTANTQYYWIGKIEALLVNPNLTDATTATLTLSLQSDFYGAFTTAAQA